MWPPDYRSSDTFACKPGEPEHSLLVKPQVLELAPLQGIGLADTCTLFMSVIHLICLSLDTKKRQEITCPCPPPTAPMANKST